MTSLALVSPLSISSYLFVILLFIFFFWFILYIYFDLTWYIPLKPQIQIWSSNKHQVGWRGSFDSCSPIPCKSPSLSFPHSLHLIPLLLSIPLPSSLFSHDFSFFLLFSLCFFLFFIRTDVFEDVTSIKPLLKYMYLLNWGMGKKIRKLRRREVRDERWEMKDEKWEGRGGRILIFEGI